MTASLRGIGMLLLCAVAACRGAPAAVGGGAGGEGWVVDFASAGPIQFGASVEESREILLDPSAVPQQPDACEYIRVRGAPDSTAVMVEGGRFVRVDVFGRGTRTAAGAGVGDTEDRIHQLYHSSVEVRPHKYTDGRYLIVSPEDAGPYRIVFETDGRHVTRYRGGVLPQVEYVEGCG